VTPLARLIAERIAATGPMPVAEYMGLCLMHPRFGYYTTRDPLGVAGDFITAPEISQMFGEVLGLALAEVWIGQGRPAPFTLAELGPGRGTLMADMLRAMRAVPGMEAAARVHLVETSPALRARQKVTLGERAVVWHDSTDDLPEGPLLLIANEFFDALPVRQFRRAGALWSEVQVGVQDGRPVLGASPPAPLPGLDHRLDDTREGDIVEICPALPAIADAIARRVARHGGAAIVVDYGGWRSLGDTVQALRGHRSVGLLDDPGEADLTAHVDFEALAAAFRAGGAAVTGMTAQGALLERLGISARAEVLAARLSGAALDSHLAAHRRLIDPSGMGQLFKAIACHPPGLPPPPGFDP
jgi:SAM-dependent MidA family methyltransferase